jgi:hypothetical protein
MGILNNFPIAYTIRSDVDFHYRPLTPKPLSDGTTIGRIARGFRREGKVYSSEKIQKTDRDIETLLGKTYCRTLHTFASI